MGLHRNILLKENKTRKQPYHFFVFLLSTPTPPPPYSSALNASSSALKPLFLLAYRITNPLLNFHIPRTKIIVFLPSTYLDFIYSIDPFHCFIRFTFSKSEEQKDYFNHFLLILSLPKYPSQNTLRIN